MNPTIVEQNFEAWLEVFKAAALKASVALKNAALASVDLTVRTETRTGAGGDRSTRFDLLSESILIKEIESFSKCCVILTEEQGMVGVGDAHRGESVPIVVIDPLDGTNNFKRGFPFASISLALWIDGKPVVGVVHNIFTDEVYFSIRGKGAFKSSSGRFFRLKVSNTNAKSQFITFIRPVTVDDYMAHAAIVFGVKTTRAVVSVALELALVAEGVTDAFIDLAYNAEKNSGGVRLVDYAAGILIVEEAGGTIWIDCPVDVDVDTDLKLQTNLVAASSRANLDYLLNLKK